MEKLIGKITHYFGKIGVGIIKIENGELNVGDTIHIKGHTSDFTQQVDSIQIEHEQIQKAKKGDDIGIKVAQKVHEHDEVYLVTE
jgi:translation elongation factor EF-1alpha